MTTVDYHYKIIIDRFRTFADNHYQLRRFTHGLVTQADLEKEAEWPWMHVKPLNINYEKGAKVYSFDVYISDLPRVEEDKTGYEAESINLCSLIMGDLLAMVNNGTLFGGDIQLRAPIQADVEIEVFTHTLVSVTATINLEVDWDWNACIVPMDQPN